MCPARELSLITATATSTSGTSCTSAADTNGIMRPNGTDGSYIYNMAINIPLNTDYTIIVYPYGTTAPNDKVTLRHVIQATK